MQLPYAIARDGKIRVYNSSSVMRRLAAAGFALSAWDMSATAPLSEASARAVTALRIELREGAGEIRALSAPPPAGTVMYDPAARLLVISLARPGAVPGAVLESLPGYRHDAVNDLVTCYPEPAALDAAREHGLKVTGTARRAVDYHAARLAESSAVTTGSRTCLGGVLRPYQQAGAAHAAGLGRSLNADEPGLGKTLQAIGAAETKGMFPVLVACPAGLRGNWARELARWVPHRTAAVGGQGVPRADYVIMSYEAVTSGIQAGTFPAFPAVVFDEAHMLKEPGSQRARAAAEVTRAVPPDGMILFMTGTPAPNGRADELIPLLRMLGILSDAPGSRSTTAQFRERFARADRETALELSRYLRSTCMIRRTKAQVLRDLPPKQRIDRWVPLEPAPRRLFDSMAREGLARAIESRAKGLVYLNALRLATGRAKARAAVDWSADFLAGTSRQLVVFAYHQDVQQALISGLRDRGYPVTSILGSQRDAEDHKARFQAGDSPVIVCSLRAAGTGHTLTAASDVLMAEQVWTPGDHWQAEDRIHRIGQREAVTAWYLLAEDTLDPWMYGLVNGKAEMAGLIADGTADGRPDDNSTVSMLISRLSSRYGATGSRAA